jgi:mono/diheme cytochrome c family protein
MKKLLIMLALVIPTLWFACGSEEKPAETKSEAPAEKEVPSSIAEGKGVGEITSVDLGDGIDQELVARGKPIYDMKCSACHKLDGKRVVGPGFEGVTNRRRPEWIMNMITNVNVMLDEDPTAQALLEECLTRMPNQNVSVSEAREILEFFRHNDEERLQLRDEAVK